ncbi:AbrB/MazE/SpoVT family DNA-binding domain-containing protein [Candidatus Gracilibacteria bacterium]|nr:AbrB/MazE/SpoVT family DNA-binding domain-containing protein [Candidatus Gracilibacteria bacterium]
MFGTKKELPNKASSGVKMHGSVTVGTKGQIVIPKDVRDMLSITEGDTLMTMTKYGKFVGFIKAEDMSDFIDLLKSECNIHN